jgi:hypothetical protein
MDPTTQYSAATNIAKDTESVTADLFFDAAQVDTTPLETGSEDLLQVATANNPGGGGATTILPFIVTKATGSNVTVATGQVNSLTYTSATFSIGSDGDKVYIDITVNASGIASAVTVSTAASVPSDTSTHAYLQIAIVEKDGSGVSEITNTRSGGSLGHAYAGGTIHTLWQV